MEHFLPSGPFAILPLKPETQPDGGVRHRSSIVWTEREDVAPLMLKLGDDLNAVDRAGNTARNTTIIRANYLTPEGVAFYKESVELFRDLSIELDMNIMYSERGHLTLAHTDAALRTARATAASVPSAKASAVGPRSSAARAAKRAAGRTGAPTVRCPPR